MDFGQILRAQNHWQAIRDQPGSEQYAQQAMDHFTDCIYIVSKRLQKLGYPVSPLTGPIYDDLDMRIARLRAAIGANPPAVLTYLWKTLGSIQFTDYNPYQGVAKFEDLKTHPGCSHDAFWNAHGLHRIPSDGLVLCGCEDSYIDIYESLEDDDDRDYLISLDIWEKDACSGGGGVIIELDSDWAPTCIGFSEIPNSKTLVGGSIRCDLISYLRTVVLECGCFPGFLGHKTFEPIRKYLTEGLPLF